MFGKLFGKNGNKSNEVNQNEISNQNETNPDQNNVDSQIDWLINNGWTDSYDVDKKTILIMDDREAIISSMMDDLYSLDDQESEFNLNSYNILKIHSKMAGFQVFDILEKAPLIEIKYALLDIILGGKKVIDGKRTMVDGVDVAIAIWDKFETAEILFFSGCIIESDSRDIFNFKDKFEEYTGDNIENYILPKDSSFDDELVKLAEFFLGINIK
jgi:hypothetical protein